MSVFSSKDVKSTSYEALPAGNYPCEINQAALGATKNGNGEVLHLSMQVKGESYPGRLIFDELLRTNKDAQFDAKGNGINGPGKAINIASQRIKQIIEANDVEDLESWDDLVGMEVIARIKRVQDAGYDPRNQVSRYLSTKPVETQDESMPF